MNDSIDPEILAIFIEEAEEILEQSTRACQQWRDDTANQNLPLELKRHLHTIKGSARMTGVMELGDFAHHLEDIFSAVDEHSLVIEPAHIDFILRGLDTITSTIDALKNDTPVPNLSAWISQSDHILKTGEVPSNTAATSAPNEASPNPPEDNKVTEDALSSTANTNDKDTTTTSSKDTLDNDDIKSITPENISTGNTEAEVVNQSESTASLSTKPLSDNATKTDLASASSTTKHTTAPLSTSDNQQTASAKSSSSKAPEKSKEILRVNSDIIDTLVNRSGEVNMINSQMRQKLEVDTHLHDELNITLHRLLDRLRQMEIQAESALQFKHLPTQDHVHDLDPLEMDRYSKLQEEARSLSEAANDLVDLKDSLAKQLRQMQQLIQRKSRITDTIHNTLMSVRMVTFERLISRFERIVRQTAHEMHKNVELIVINPEVEIDRHVLEKLTVVLEHLIRNAIAHGIEPEADRLLANKTAAGKITIECQRKGSEITLLVADNGAGINRDKIKQKAEKMGLVEELSTMDDQALLSLIFRAGVSTAEQVSQVAGRGVGMDIVYNELCALGGSIQIESTENKGTCFTLHLPTTLSVTRVLIFHVNHGLFSVILDDVDSVIHIEGQKLLDLNSEEIQHYTFEERNYDLFHAHRFLGLESKAIIAHHLYPVLLLKNERVALIVDALQKTEEVMIKPLGPQLSQWPALSGVCVLASGEAVLILDLYSLVQGEEHQAESTLSRPDKRKKIFIVDDSVTVRKITAKLLERHGYEVITARDGLEAKERLEHETVDLMLLDIEMPRMDGFELAEYIRSDPQLQKLPIMMITSRTGEKHRHRAENLTVNDYLGKPFKEEELLKKIHRLLDGVSGHRDE